MSPRLSRLLELAAHPHTPDQEALSALRAYRAEYAKNPPKVDRSFNGQRQRLEELEGEVLALRATVASLREHGTRQRDDAIRAAYDQEGATMRGVAKQFGVSAALVSNIVNSTSK